MLIQYRKIQPRTSRTWFAKLKVKDAQKLQNQLTEFLLYLSEKCIKPREEPWISVSECSRKHWGYSEYEGHANNLVSVLGGAIKKLRSGGDLTEKQLLWVSKICHLMPELGDSRRRFEYIQFELVEQFEPTGHPLVDLQSALFDQ